MNEILFDEAKKYIPGGVNSPVRAFTAVGGVPKFIKTAKGACFWDEDNNRFIDYICSWGANIVGHSNTEVVKSVGYAIENGLSYGTPTEKETEITKIIISCLPSIEKLRLVNSGTEATMSAIRLSRGFNKRNKIIKFEGCYHGHYDSLLVKAGSGLSTLGSPTSDGVPEDFIKNTIVLPYNNSQAIIDTFNKIGNEISCVIIEPIVGNMNLIIPNNEFLQTIRNITLKYGTILIYDEVMTGFRVALGGAQIIQNITPDLTTLGKVIGGGMPLAAFGGRKDIMDKLSPIGNVYQAGTLSGNPIAVTAGIKTLEIIKKDNCFYQKLNDTNKYLTEGINNLANEYSLDISANYIGGMFGIYFNKIKPKNFADMEKSNFEQFKLFFNEMLKRGIYFAPSAFEAGFISIAHNKGLIDDTLNKIQNVFSIMSK